MTERLRLAPQYLLNDRVAEDGRAFPNAKPLVKMSAVETKSSSAFASHGNSTISSRLPCRSKTRRLESVFFVMKSFRNVMHLKFSRCSSCRRSFMLSGFNLGSISTFEFCIKKNWESWNNTMCSTNTVNIELQSRSCRK